MKIVKAILFVFILFFSINSFSQDPIIIDSTSTEIPYAIIEKAPVYPGCPDTNNAELKKCMSKKISYFVGNNFDIRIARKLELPPGNQRISVQFKINKKGYVTNVRARASHPLLEKEAIRVVKLIPRMIPGKQKGKAVNVLYSLPILFKVEETKKEKKERLKQERKKNRSN